LGSRAGRGGLAKLAAAGYPTMRLLQVHPYTRLPEPVDPKGDLMRRVKLEFTWSKTGFDNVMEANFSIKNPTQYSFKDIEIKCTHFAPSGTEIDSNTRTIYQVVSKNSTKVTKHMNMGFIHSQASSSNCQITDLVPM
jgi:hypothetical protein